MTKLDIIKIISEKMNLPKTSCETFIDTLIDEIKDCLLRGEKLTIKGFATFETKERDERQGRNPKTGKVDTYPAFKSVKCRISKNLKDAVNGK